MSMSTEQCQQIIVDVFSDQGGVELLKAMAEGDHNPPNPPRTKFALVQMPNVSCDGLARGKSVL